MSNLKELRYGVCTYKIKKNALQNLKIKVKISKVTSTFQIDETSNSVNYTEEFIFTWQQKVYSPSQNLKTPNDSNHNTAQTKNSLTKRLFSYVNHEKYTKQSKIYTTKEPDAVSYIGDMIDKVERPQGTGNEAWRAGIKQNPIVAVHEQPHEQQQARLMPQLGSEHMHLMADLGYPVSGESAGWEPQEVVLCRISVDDNSCCTVQPDFTKPGQQYIVENPATKENFEYTITNVSAPTPSVEKEKEVKLLKELYARSVSRIQSLVGTTFDEQVPDDALRLYICGEILSAYDFEHSNIYIQYFVDIPEDWLVSELDQLTGITQISRGKVTETGYLCHFSFPFEFNMLYQRNIYKQLDSDVLPKWPILYVEVFSIDSWTRYRTEGYGYTQLPTAPGMHRIDIPCWRPISDSITNELRRFFVGGSAELEDLTFTSVPATFEGNLLSKYGFRTMSTGNVVLRLNCLQQSNSFINEKLNRGDSRHLIDRISGSNIHFGVMEVIKRFHQARNNLIKIRQAYLDDVSLTENV